MMLMVKELLKHFMKNNYKRLVRKNLEYKKWLKEKVINYMSNRKFMIIHLIAGFIKKRFDVIPSYKNEPIFS